MSTQYENNELSIVDLIRIVHEYRWLIISVLLISALSGLSVSFALPTKYSTTIVIGQYVHTTGALRTIESAQAVARRIHAIYDAKARGRNQIVTITGHNEQHVVEISKRLVKRHGEISKILATVGMVVVSDTHRAQDEPVVHTPKYTMLTGVALMMGLIASFVLIMTIKLVKIWRSISEGS